MTESEKKAVDEKKKRKAKIVRKVFRTIHTEPLKSFVQKKGIYAKHTRKMLSHKYRIRLLVRSFKNKSRYSHALKRKNTLKVDRDFSERRAPVINISAQHKYFNKD